MGKGSRRRSEDNERMDAGFDGLDWNDRDRRTPVESNGQNSIGGGESPRLQWQEVLNAEEAEVVRADLKLAFNASRQESVRSTHTRYADGEPCQYCTLGDAPDYPYVWNDGVFSGGKCGPAEAE